MKLEFASHDTKDVGAMHEHEHRQCITFLKGRLKFCHVDGLPANNSAGAPSCLISYGENNAKILESITISGKYIKLR